MCPLFRPTSPLVKPGLAVHCEPDTTSGPLVDHSSPAGKLPAPAPHVADAVPLTAVAGLAVLGVLALVCAAVIAAFQGDAAAGDALSNLIPNSWPGRRRRK